MSENIKKILEKYNLSENLITTCDPISKKNNAKKETLASSTMNILLLLI